MVKGVLTAIRAPVIVGSALVLPFLALELIHWQTLRGDEGFPVALFAVLWAAPVAFAFLLVQAVRIVQSGTRSPRLLVRLGLTVAALTCLALLWGNLIVDQWPCFMGVPNCD